MPALIALRPTTAIYPRTILTWQAERSSHRLESLRERATCPATGASFHLGLPKRVEPVRDKYRPLVA